MKNKEPKSQDVLSFMEGRFKLVTGFEGDLSKYPVLKEDGAHFDTDKAKARDFAEVFTPIYMVDEMLNQVPMTPNASNLDLCAGHGQFTIRMLRKFYEEYGENFDIKKYLSSKHFMNELQVSSCYKLSWIFLCRINLAIGDARKLNLLPKNWKGVWQYVEGIDSWVNVTGFVRALLKKTGGSNSRYDVKKEETFVRLYESFVSRLEITAKEHEMSIKEIVSTKLGRKHLLHVINKASDGVETNWQDKETPEWIVKEMVASVPDLMDLKKILVLFNVEFLEELVRQRKIDPKKIDFGYDSEIEGLYADRVYKVGTFSVGKSMEELKIATNGKFGRYDVIFSNPPYQIEDGGYGKSARPVYHEIAMHAMDVLQPRYVCMITPSRWMVGGKGLDDYRARMLSDKRLRLIQDFPGNRDVFPTVDINGGVSYFVWDHDYQGLCEFNGIPRDIGEFDVLVRDNVAAQILRKILVKHPEGQFCNKRVLPRKPFGLPTNFKNFVPEGTPGAVKCYVANKDGFERWVDGDSFSDDHGAFSSWKAHIPRACPGSDSSKAYGKTIVHQCFIGERGAVCLETYLVSATFNTKKEAENYSSFLLTKFYRFMLSLRVISQDINTQKFAWVPDMGDYTRTYTDEDLYEHFGLTMKEREHIEKSIKAL